MLPPWRQISRSEGAPVSRAEILAAANVRTYVHTNNIYECVTRTIKLYLVKCIFTETKAIYLVFSVLVFFIFVIVMNSFAIHPAKKVFEQNAVLWWHHCFSSGVWWYATVQHHVYITTPSLFLRKQICFSCSLRNWTAWSLSSDGAGTVWHQKFLLKRRGLELMLLSKMLSIYSVTAFCF